MVGEITKIIKEGELTANGSEQTVVEVIGFKNVVEVMGFKNVGGYIDLSAMTDDDTVVLRRYIKVSSGGEYKLHASQPYNGVQSEPLIRFPFIIGYYGIKVTLQQTSGTFKTFPYQFFERAYDV